MYIFGKKKFSKYKQPKINPYLDQYNPFLIGMNDCVFFGEGLGNTYENLIDKNGYGSPSGSDSAWDKNRKFVGVKTTQNSYLSFGNNRLARFANNSQPFTIRTMFKFNDLSRSINTLFSRYGDGNVSNTSALEFALRFNASGNPISYAIGTTTARFGAITWTIPLLVNVIYDLYWVVNGSTINLYVRDGGHTLTSVPSGTGVWKTLGGNSLGPYDAAASTSPIILGADSTDSTRYGDMTFYLFQSWINRALTIPEIRYLSFNPYCVLAPGKTQTSLQNSLIAAIAYYNRKNSVGQGRIGTRTIFY